MSITTPPGVQNSGDLSDLLSDKPLPAIGTNLAVALDHAKRGIAVFPITLKEHGRWTPIVGWKAAATADREKIAAWWKQYPNARVGLPADEQNDITILDIDVKNGKDGFATLAALGFPDWESLSPVRSRTPSGGGHVFFRGTFDLKNSAGEIGSGLDVRTTRIDEIGETKTGYVLAPGSFKAGKRYEPLGAPLGSVELPPFPDALRPPAKSEREPVTVLSTASDTQKAWAAERLLKWASDLATAPGGERNETLNKATAWAGGAAAHGFLTEEAAREGLSAAWSKLGKSASEFRSTFKSGWQAGLRKPISDFPRERTAADFDDLPVQKKKSYALDENGIIRAFTDRHSGELLFDHHAGKWFRFDGNVWRREETKLAHHYAHELSTKFAAKDPKKEKALNRVSTWESVERGARTVREFACTSDTWNRDHWLLGTPGGTVELRTGKLRGGRPDDRISRLTAIAPIDVSKFDAHRDCPTWMSFLNEALAGDGAAIRFLQQWGGYSLTGDTREQVLLFVYGPGGSGKGTAINTIADVLGEYGVNVGMETLTASKHQAHLTELARLHGARMARASETEKGRAWAENRIKTLTGQDRITANFMRQDHFEFLPEFKLTIFGNNRPSLKDVDAAIRRRFMVLPFDHPPARTDQRLPERLKAEWPGILSWLIVGCLDWQTHGLVRPDVLQRATEQYFAEQDSFGQWISECCETGPALADTVANLWESWRSYASINGEDPGSRRKTFPESLQQRGYVAIKDRSGVRGHGYRGVRIVDHDPF